MKKGNTNKMEWRHSNKKNCIMNSDVKNIILKWLLPQNMVYVTWRQLLKEIGIVNPKKYYPIPIIPGAFGFTAIEDGKERKFQIILAEHKEAAKLTLETNNGKEFYEYSMINGHLLLTHVYYETRNRIFNIEVTNSSIKMTDSIKAKVKESNERHYFNWEFVGRPINVNLIMQNWKLLKRFFLRINKGVNFLRAYKRITVISGVYKSTMLPLEKISFTHLCFVNGREDIIQKLEAYDGQFSKYVRKEIEGTYSLNADGTYSFFGNDEHFEKEVISRMNRIFKKKS